MGRNSLDYVTTLISLVTISIVMMFLICYTTFRKHMFKGLCEFMGGRLSRWVTIWPCLKAIRLVLTEIKKILTCHVTLQNHMIEGSSNFMSGSSS